jgi:DHA1 family multidrug resistance protein-like MFS transporter
MGTVSEEVGPGGFVSRDFRLLLVIVFFTTFASVMVSSSAVIFLVKSLAVTQSATVAFIGVLMSVSSVAMILGNFAGGFLADRVGRKHTIGLAGAVLAPSLFVYVVVPSVFLVVTVYFVHMFAESLFQPAFTAFVADLSKLSSRGKAFGRFNLFWFGSMVPAPLVGGFLVDSVGLRIPFMIASLVAVVGIIASLGLVGVNGEVASGDKVSDGESAGKGFMPFRRVLLFFGAIGVLSGLASGLLGPLTRDFPIYKLNADATALGLVFSLGSGLAIVLVQVPGGRLTDKFGRKPLMLLSLLATPFVVGLAFTDSVAEFIAVSAGLFAFANLAAPAYQAWLMELVDEERRAKVMGFVNAVTGAGAFLGPLISTWLWETQAWVAVPFIVAALSWLMQIPPILKLRETKTREKHAS